MRSFLNDIGEFRLFCFCLLMLGFTFVIYEYTSIKEITSAELSTILMVEVVVFYPVRYLLFGIGRFKIDQINTQKLSPTFWISFSIILVGLLLCTAYYLANKDNGRYEYQNGLVIDKKTGEAKRINIK